MQLILALGTSALLSQCALPPEGPYAKAEWTVHTSISKDTAPVGVSVDKIDDAEMPSLEEIAEGLPSKKGANGWTVGNSKLAENNGAGAALSPNDPPLPFSEGKLDHASHPTLLAPNEDLAANDNAVPGPTPLPEPVALPAVASSAPEHDITVRPASPASLPPMTAENAAHMMAQNSRPPVAARGVNLPHEVAMPKLSELPANTATAQNSSATPEVSGATTSSDLSDILALAKKLETAPKK